MSNAIADTKSAVVLRDLQACAKSSLSEKTWLSARVCSVTLSCTAFLIIIMLVIYCCLQTSRLNQLHRLDDIHKWYKQDREEAIQRRAWGEGHAAKAAGAFFG